MAAVSLAGKGTTGICEFIIEDPPGAAQTIEDAVASVPETPLQDRERDVQFYREHFASKPHENLLARDSPLGPLALSIVLEGACYRGLLRTCTGSERHESDAQAMPIGWWRRALGLQPNIKLIAGAFSPSIPVGCLTNCISRQAIMNDLVELEEKQIVKRFKFGVTYLRAGQSTEMEMLSNTSDITSPAYNSFLEFLGEKIELRGWKGFRAGLDVQSGLTGESSVFTNWGGYDVMFHVATLLPYNPNDAQQLERKRHIGNDIVIIVFQESEKPFEISSISSKQTQVVLVVRPDAQGGNQYYITACRKKGVPEFAPGIPSPPLVPRNDCGREFLLHKLISAELASYRSPAFLPKIQRTRKDLLLNIANKHLPPK